MNTIRFHLTSHPMTDFPCICMYVFDKVKRAGYDTSKMTCKQIQDTYYKLCHLHPEYKPLIVK